MENREIIRIVIIGFLIVGLSFQFIGYATPGWFSYTYGNYDSYRSVSLWYTILCPNGTNCQTESHLDAYLKQPRWKEMQYAYQVASNVMAVLSFIFCLTGTVFTSLNIFGRTERILFTFISMNCFLLSGSLAWRNVGSWASEMEASKRINPSYDFDFPYSIFLTAIGSILILCVCVQQIISVYSYVQRRFAAASNEPGYDRMEDSMPSSYQNRMLLILMGLTAVGTLFQLIGFVSPGWMITKARNITSYLGLWYSVTCEVGKGCKLQSYHDKFSSEDFFAIMYAIIVGNKVTATLSLTCSCFVVVMSVLICLAKKAVEHFVIIIQLFILLSASLVWPVVGEMAAHSAAWRKATGDKAIIMSPYSMILTGLGSVILLVVFGIHTFNLGKVLFFNSKQTTNSESSSQNFAFKTF